MKKIAVSSEGKELTAKVDPHFGRAAYFVIYDLEKDTYEVVENPAAMEARGAGIAAATFLVEKGVEAVVTGHCGPKAFAVLSAAGIKVASAPAKTIEEVIQAAKSGQLEFISAPTVDTHFGGGIPGLGKILGGGMGRGCGRPGSGGGACRRKRGQG